MKITRWPAALFSLFVMVMPCFAQRGDSTTVLLRAINKYRESYGFEISGNLLLSPPRTDLRLNAVVRKSDNFLTILVRPRNIPGYSHMQVFQLMLPLDSGAAFVITDLDSVHLTCSGQELIFQQYQKQPIGPGLPKYCDSVIRANKDKEVSAAIILSQFCHPEIPQTQIAGYFDLLDAAPRFSFYGRRVSEYLSGREALQTGKFFGYGTLQDSIGRSKRFPWLTSDYTVMYFWFSGSAASKAGFAALDSLYRVSSRAKFQVITISCDGPESQAAWKDYLQKSTWPWINLLDINQQTARRYAIGVFPTQLVLDRNLKIVKINPSTGELAALIADR
jgi:hypothetical protein